MRSIVWLTARRSRLPTGKVGRVVQLSCTDKKESRERKNEYTKRTRERNIYIFVCVFCLFE